MLEAICYSRILPYLLYGVGFYVLYYDHTSAAEGKGLVILAAFLWYSAYTINHMRRPANIALRYIKTNLTHKRATTLNGYPYMWEAVLPEFKVTVTDSRFSGTTTCNITRFNQSAYFKYRFKKLVK